MVEERPTLCHMGIMNPQAVALFRQVYRGNVNPMTPHIWSRRMIAAGIVALVAIVISFREEWPRVRVVLGFQPAAPIVPHTPSPAEERGGANREIAG